MKDKKGIELEEFDLIEIFHFIGSRRKKFYMYKWVKKIDNKLMCFHLNSKNEYFSSAALKSEDFEIIQSENWQKLK